MIWKWHKPDVHGLARPVLTRQEEMYCWNSNDNYYMIWTIPGVMEKRLKEGVRATARSMSVKPALDYSLRQLLSNVIAPARGMGLQRANTISFPLRVRLLASHFFVLLGFLQCR